MESGNEFFKCNQHGRILISFADSAENFVVGHIINRRLKSTKEAGGERSPFLLWQHGSLPDDFFKLHHAGRLRSKGAAAKYFSEIFSEMPPVDIPRIPGTPLHPALSNAGLYAILEEEDIANYHRVIAQSSKK